MTETQSKQPQINYPTRTILVTGERVAMMTQMTVRVSRAEQRLVNLSMSGAPTTRDAVRRASERLLRAMHAFDDEIKEVSDELEAAGRTSNQRRRPAPPASKPVLARNKETKTDLSQQAPKPTQAVPQQQGKKQKASEQRQPNEKAAPQQQQPKPKPAAAAAAAEATPAELSEAVTVFVERTAAPETLQSL